MKDGPEQQGTLSIVVPAYDEERRLPALLETLDREADEMVARAGLNLVEVIVVDDGSSDRTGALLSAYGGLGGRLRTLRFERNRGKGAAVQAGMLAAQGDVALLTDVDLSAPLEEVVSLAAALDTGADVAMGSRGLPGSRILVHQRRPRELMGKAFNLALRVLTGLPYRDTQCGFKLFSLSSTRALFEQQQIEGFAFDAELCVAAKQRGLVVVEVPVRWSNDPDTHVGLRGSASMAVDLVRIAWWSRTRAGP